MLVGIVAASLLTTVLVVAGATSIRKADAAVSNVAPASRPDPAYYLVASDGGIFDFGGAPFFGSMGGTPLNRPVVGMDVTRDGGGYWEVASDGGVFSFGDAAFHGSTGNISLNQPIVGMAAAAGGGYWLVASDGGIFSFGAPFLGSMGAIPLNRPIVGMAATPDGNGYWLVASDGGVFSFGDAAFHGSTGNIVLNKPIVGMTSTPSGNGYTMVASDGGIFTFGDATFEGSLGGTPLARPVVAMANSPNGGGYWFSDTNGAVTSEGPKANYWGSAPQVINKPVVGMAANWGVGGFSGSPYQSGAYGYDVSNWQCGQTLPGHSIGVVEVVGQSFGAVNSCLASEAAWAGGGLNLYVFLTFGTQSTGDPACGAYAADGLAVQSCYYGFAAAQDAYAKAAGAGIDAQVAWWMDVEGSWSGDTNANAALVQGALWGIRSEGINNAGIYASPGVWSGIVGRNYQPPVPYWAADWGPPATTTCASVKSQYSYLPTGPVVLVQYSDNVNGLDGDYAC